MLDSSSSSNDASRKGFTRFGFIDEADRLEVEAQHAAFRELDRRSRGPGRRLHRGVRESPGQSGRLVLRLSSDAKRQPGPSEATQKH